MPAPWRSPAVWGIMVGAAANAASLGREGGRGMVPVTPEALIVLIIVGLIAGWLAGLITQGSGFGVVGNIIIGIIGAFIGFYLLGYLNISLSPGLVGVILTATLGAVILLFIVGLLRR
jgi:uncharacterized membrane protein YeaQ/YmgE (transglycosylase-associated protein family)